LAVPLVERDQCLKDLNNLILRTPDAFRAAMRRMRNAAPEDLLDRTPRSGSNLTRDYAVAEIEKLWRGNRNVRIYEKGMLKLFVVNEIYAIRVKKFDRRSRSRNVVTQDDRRFRFQLPMKGIPRLVHLELGYVPNMLRTTVDDVRLVCLNGRGVYWSYSIENQADNDNVYDLFQGTPDPNPKRPTLVPREQGVADPKVKIKPKKR
jgi:hypothetical protein